MNKIRILLVFVILHAHTTGFAHLLKTDIKTEYVEPFGISFFDNDPRVDGKRVDGKRVAENRTVSNVRRVAKRCSENLVAQRIFEEYGAVFGANRNKTFLPEKCLFKNEAEVTQFQNKARFSSEVIDGVKVQLQPEALKSFLAARADAQKSGIELSPQGSDASRRSYDDTLKLWNNRVNENLDYWVKNKKLSRAESARIRALSIDKQISEILKLEEKAIYFGKGGSKSILQSVAAPGSSQHNLMLALDIKQHANPKAREILAKHGWFQTVKNDAPHFTYLGLKEKDLTTNGLQRTSAGGRTVWVAVSTDRVSGNSTTRLNDDDENPSLEFLELPNEKVPATASSNILLPISMEPLLSLLTQRYYLQTRRKLHITSGFRTPERQAKAMHRNLSDFTTSYVARTYGNSAEVWEVIKAYQENSEDEKEAIEAMTKVLKSQIKKGKVLSRHMLEKAFDIRSWGEEAANLSVLRSIVREINGKVVVEKNHYHVEFR